MLAGVLAVRRRRDHSVAYHLSAMWGSTALNEIDVALPVSAAEGSTTWHAACRMHNDRQRTC